MAHMKTHMDLLAKHLLAVRAERVNEAGATSRHGELDYDYDEEAKYLNN